MRAVLRLSISRGLLMSLCLISHVYARPIIVQWDIDASLRLHVTGFMVRSCTLLVAGACEMKDAITKALPVWQQQVRLPLPANPAQRQCFQVQALRGSQRSSPSASLCIPEEKDTSP